MPADLLRAFVENARLLYVSEDLDDTLARLTHAAVRTVPGCEVASVSLLGPSGAITTRAPTDPVAERVDAIQYDAGEGPCLDAASSEELVVCHDTRNDDRWPRFAPRAASELGVGSMLSCRLSLVGPTPQVLGALNLYATRPAAFGDADLAIAAVLSASAGALVEAANTSANLRRALASRDVIGQAKGILMARQGVTADDAFDMLRRASQRANVKLRDLAAEIAASAADTPAEGRRILG